MKLFSALGLIFLLAISSCGKLYLRIRYDVRDFKPRSTDELLSYLERKDIACDFHYRITEVAFDSQSVSAYKPGWKEGLRPIQVLAFDSTGSMVMQWAVCEGFFETLGTFDTFPPKHEGILTSRKLQDDLQQYRDNNGHVPDVNHFPEFDLCLIVYWSRAFGEMGLRNIRPVLNYRNRFPDKRMLIILVSLDPQKEWQSGR
jgi:hypothetical protein